MRLSYPPELPVSRHKDEIWAAIKANQVIIVAGDTGSGKTTQLPKMCLEAGLGKKGLIGCTQPRRIAALSVADRVAEEIGRDYVGSRIRFQDNVPAQTRIKFMTDGILLAETRSDRSLLSYDTIIIDEAHERSLNIDFLLGYIKQLLPDRPELKLIISSATIDTKKFSQHFAGARTIPVTGRLFPITTRYHAPEKEDKHSIADYVTQAVEAVEDIAADPFSGDVLVFLPTERDIFDVLEQLEERVRTENLVLPLFGRMQSSDQKRIFLPSSKRKIILATNIAETSITVPGIQYVVDSGLARISRYNVRTGTTSLRVARISRASCDQRQGRCGRTGPGTCIRLYSEEDYLARDAYTLPEMQRSNLAEVILQMVSLDLGAPEHFPFVDPPAPRAIREGFRTLQELGALKADRTMTRNGRIMAGLPLPPRIARIVVEAAAQGALREACIIAAALSVQDPRVRPLDQETKADEAHKKFADTRSDFLTLLNIWKALHENKKRVSWSMLSRFCRAHYLSWQRMREWLDVHEQLRRIVAGKKGFPLNETAAEYDGLHKALTSGFLRNFGRKKEKNLYLTPGSKQVALFPGSSLHNRGCQWIVAADLVETTQLFARTAAQIDVEWLEELGGALCKKSWSHPRWEKKSGKVIADEQVSLFGIPIVSGRKVNYGRINKTTLEEARAIFIQEALVNGRLAGRYPFLEHNKALILQYREIEERVRRHSIVADELQLFAFYEKRLGNTYDRFTLNRLLRRKKDDTFLRLSKNDVCCTAPAEEELYLFPQTIRAGDTELSLQYLFEPGSSNDGVTVLIPAHLVTTIKPAIFEWLVPGLLPEKIHFLLKRLPKKIRKNLVPIPDTVDRILDCLDMYNGSLYQGLEQALLKLYRIQVQRAAWQVRELPAHLRMNFQLIDKNGKKTASSSSFLELTRKTRAPDQTTSRRVIDELPEVPDITAKDLDTLVPRHAPSGMLYYPLLFFDEKKGQIKARYTETSGPALKENTRAVQELYSQQFPGEISQLKKMCKTAVTGQSASWLSLGANLSAAELKDALFSFILKSLFAITPHALPSTSEFTRKVNTIRKQGFLREAKNIEQCIVRAVSRRKEAVKAIQQWEGRARKTRSLDPDRLQEYQAILEQILPHDFLGGATDISLDKIPRYLQALIIRIERAEHAPGKDHNKAKRVIQARRRLDQIAEFHTPSPQCRHCLKQYREMVEELRVSVFAPELGTAMAVSEKKLELFWQVVEDNCRHVE
ncbi:MAG: ATP-dependent RNA helicase HrpA [Desulfobulbus propionicus]|nr:MAG: ATP-dependent RNA helicase HrpA [Desulfobulbus propionicus]